MTTTEKIVLTLILIFAAIYIKFTIAGRPSYQCIEERIDIENLTRTTNIIIDCAITNNIKLLDTKPHNLIYNLVDKDFITPTYANELLKYLNEGKIIWRQSTNEFESIERQKRREQTIKEQQTWLIENHHLKTDTENQTAK
jgi:hypothetical protein